MGIINISISIKVVVSSLLMTT